jgi:HEAT repeat protein
MSDPDVIVRTRAFEALSESADDVDPTRLRDALEDPSDAVRAAAIALTARRRAPDLSGLFPFLPARQWPLAQRRALEVLPSLVHRVGLSDPALSSLLLNVGGLGSPPTSFERERLAELARAVGRHRVEEVLAQRDSRRLGATWLLLADGTMPSLRAVAALASDELEEVRLAAAAAHRRLDETGVSLEEQVVARTVDLIAVERSTEADVIGLLVGALRDPDRVVRDRAWAALTVADWQALLGWVREALRAGPAEDASLAAYVAERLMLSQVASAIMDRATRTPAEAGGPFESALASFGLEPRDLSGIVLDVEASRRDAAVWIAWRAGGRPVLEYLRALLEDPSGPVRRAALEVMHEAVDPGVHQVAVKALEEDPSTLVRAAAVRTLAGASREVRAAALERAGGDPDPGVRAAALSALTWGLARAAVPHLLRALEDGDERVWGEALRQLAEPDRHDAEVWEALQRCRKEQRTRLIAALAGDSPERLEALALGNLRSLNESDRLLAVELAGMASTPASLQGAMEALKDPSVAVRTAAAEALASLRHPAAAAALRDALSDPDQAVRVGAVRALAAIDDAGALRYVLSALKDPDRRVRKEVARAIGSVPMAGTTVDLIMDWVAEEGSGIAPSVGWLLERVAGADAFIERLRSLDQSERLRAVPVVTAIGGALAVTALVGALSDPDQEVRVRALRGLADLGDRRAIPAVERTIANDPVHEVASEAQETLRRLVEEGADQS